MEQNKKHSNLVHKNNDKLITSLHLIKHFFNYFFMSFRFQILNHANFLISNLH
jgi:hypothetical protein